LLPGQHAQDLAILNCAETIKIRPGASRVQQFCGTQKTPHLVGAVRSTHARAP